VPLTHTLPALLVSHWGGWGQQISLVEVPVASDTDLAIGRERGSPDGNSQVFTRAAPMAANVFGGSPAMLRTSGQSGGGSPSAQRVSSPGGSADASPKSTLSWGVKLARSPIPPRDPRDGGQRRGSGYRLPHASSVASTAAVTPEVSAPMTRQPEGGGAHRLDDSAVQLEDLRRTLARGLSGAAVQILPTGDAQQQSPAPRHSRSSSLDLMRTRLSPRPPAGARPETPGSRPSSRPSSRGDEPEPSLRWVTHPLPASNTHMHIHTRAHKHTCTRAHMHTRTHMYIPYRRLQTHAHAHTHIHIHAHAQTHCDEHSSMLRTHTSANMQIRYDTVPKSSAALCVSRSTRVKRTGGGLPRAVGWKYALALAVFSALLAICLRRVNRVPPLTCHYQPCATGISQPRGWDLRAPAVLERPT